MSQFFCGFLLSFQPQSQVIDYSSPVPSTSAVAGPQQVVTEPVDVTGSKSVRWLKRMLRRSPRWQLRWPWSLALSLCPLMSAGPTWFPGAPVFPLSPRYVIVSSYWIG
jgi:hypothetical protein